MAEHLPNLACHSTIKSKRPWSLRQITADASVGRRKVRDELQTRLQSLEVRSAGLHTKKCRDVTQWVECLPGVHEALSASPSTGKVGELMQASNPNTWEVEFKVILDYA